MTAQPACPPSCPTCKKAVGKEQETFPFCSQRCKLVDLGSWLEGRYVIPGPSMAMAGTQADGEEALFESDVEPPEDGKLPRA